MSTARIENGKDVVTFLVDQHDAIKTAFSNVATLRGEERKVAFVALRRMLAVHEAVEEEIVHPAARATPAVGDEVVAARLREEHDAKEALVALEGLDVDASEFRVRLLELQASVLAHAELEEREELASLAEWIDPARLQRMRRAVEIAEAFAPTRPHPGLESAAANILVGPFLAMIDRARDALSRPSGEGSTP